MSARLLLARRLLLRRLPGSAAALRPSRPAVWGLALQPWQRRRRAWRPCQRRRGRRRSAACRSGQPRKSAAARWQSLAQQTAWPQELAATRSMVPAAHWARSAQARPRGQAVMAAASPRPVAWPQGLRGGRRPEAGACVHVMAAHRAHTAACRLLMTRCIRSGIFNILERLSPTDCVNLQRCAAAGRAAAAAWQAAQCLPCFRCALRTLLVSEPL